MTALFPRALAATLLVSVPALGADAHASFLHSPPAEAKMGEPLPIEGNLAGSETFDRLVVMVRGPGEEYEEVSLELQYGDLYRVQLPASRMVPPAVEYYVEGVRGGDRVPLFATGAKPVKVAIAGDLPGKAKGKDKAKDKEPEKDTEAEPDKEKVEPEKAALTVEELQERLAKRCKKNKKTRECQDLLAREKEAREQARRDREEREKAEKAAKDKDAQARKDLEAHDKGKDRAPDKEKDARRDDEHGKAKDRERDPDARRDDERGKVNEKDRERDTRRDDERGKAKDKSADKRAGDRLKKDGPAAEVPRKRSDLEEDLAIYTAEQSGGVVQRLDDDARHGALMPTILTALQLRQLGVRYVYEALDRVPGMAVTRDVQGTWRVAVRGVRSDPEVLFLLNGQRLNNFYDGRALGNLPVDGFERIEIYRGPATADFGPQDFQAVVNLITNRTDGLRAGFSGGLYEAFDGHLTAARTFGPVTVFADADVANQYGYFKPVLKDGLDTAGTRGQHTQDKRFLVNAGGGLSFANDAVGKLTAQARVLVENSTPLIGRFDVVGNESKLGWMALQVALSWERPVSDTITVSARLWFDQQATDRLWQLTYDGYQARASDPTTLFPDGIEEQIKFTTRSFGLTGGADMRLPANNHLRAGLNVGLDTLADFATLANYTPGTNVYLGKALKRPDGLVYPTEDGHGGRGPAADRVGFGLYAYDSWTPHEVISMQAGLRLDFMSLPTADADGAWTGKAIVPSFGPRLGLALSPIRSLVLRGSYGRSFRAPTVQELAEPIPNSDVNQGRFEGNSLLTGSYIDAVDGGLEFIQAVGDARLKLRGQLFFQRITNSISMVDNSGNIVPYRNRPLGVQAFGAEGEAHLELSRRTTAWLNVSWVRPEDLGVPTQSRILTESSQVRLNAGFSLPLGPFLNFDVVTRFASERRNDSRTVLELIRRYTLPGNTTVMAQLRTEPLFDRVELVVTGQNVFDFDYADDATRPDRITGGVPREGLMVFGSVHVEL